MAKKNAEKPSAEEHGGVPLEDRTALFHSSFDLGLAAALICTGFELVSLGRENPRKVRFLFRRSDGIDEIANNYWSDRLEVKARAYFDALKMLKNRLYSE